MQFYLLDVTECCTMIELAYGTPDSLKVVGYLFIEDADEMLKILNRGTDAQDYLEHEA